MYLLKLQSRVWDSNWFGSKQMICELWLKSAGKMRTLWTLNHFWTEHEMRIFLKLEDWNWFGSKQMICELWTKTEGKMGTLWSLNHFSAVTQNAKKKRTCWNLNYELLAQFVLAACMQNHFHHLTQNAIWIVFFVTFAQLHSQNFTLLCANWLAKFFRAFCIVSRSDKVALEFRLYLKVELVAAETAKLNILNRMYHFVPKKFHANISKNLM